MSVENIRIIQQAVNTGIHVHIWRDHVRHAILALSPNGTAYCKRTDNKPVSYQLTPEELQQLAREVTA